MKTRSLSPRRILAASIVTLLSIQATVCAVDYTYTPPAAGTGGTVNWSTGTHWDATPVSGIDTRLFFGGTLNASAAVATANDIATPPFKLNHLTFNASGPGTGTAPTYAISGSQLEFITNTALATPTMTLNAGGTVKPTLTISNNLLLTNDLAISATTNATLSGAITGASNLAISGGGTVTLNSTSNTFGGVGKTITVSGGSVINVARSDNNPNALGSSSNKLILNGGTLRYSPANDPANSLANDIEFQTGGTNFLHNASGSGANRGLGISGALTGSGGFTTNEPVSIIALLNISGNSTMTGTVTAAGNSLFIAANSLRDALAGANLNLNTGNAIFTGSAANAGAIADFSRSITVSAASSLSAGSGFTFTQTGTLTGTTTLSINTAQTGNFTTAALSNQILNPGAGSVVVFNGDVSGFTGGLTVNQGTLRIGTAATLPASFGLLTLANTAGVLADLNGRSITVKGLATGGAAGGNIQGNSTGSANTLTIDTTVANRSYAGVISNGGSVALNLSKIGTNTQTFTGVNSYTGTTAITVGAVNIQTSTGLGSAAGGTTVTAGAALELQGGIAVGAEALTLDGTGVGGSGGALRNVSGSNSFAGAITLGGATRINSDTANTTLTLTGAVGGTNTNLTVGGSGNTTIANAISTGSGSLAKDGSGTVKLAGANAYTGGTTVSNGTLIGTTSSALGTNGNLSITVGNTFAYRPTAAGALNLGTGVLTLVNTNRIGTALGGTAGQSAITSSVAAAAAGTITVNISGIPGVTVTSGSNDLITAASGLGGATYTLGTILNATNFTVGALAANATAVSITATSETALANEYWKGGFAGNTKVWAISNGSTASNWASDAGGTATSLTPGTAATVNFSATGGAVGDKTGMTLGADMSIAGIVVSDTDAIGLTADAFTLALGTGGITVDSGAGAVTLAAAIALNGNQAWAKNSATLLTVSGGIGGTGNVALNNGSTLASGITISTLPANNAGTITNSGGNSGSTLISAVIGSNVTGVIQNSATSQLTLSGANPFATTYTATLGTLSISHVATFASAGQFNLASGGRLEVAAADANLSKLATGGGGSGVVAGSFLRLSANQAAAGAGNGPGTIAGTLELNLATIAANYVVSLGAGSTVRTLINSAFTPTATDLLGSSTFDFGATTTSTIANGISTSTSGAKVLTVTSTASSGNISGAITDGSGSLSIVKTGTGKVNLISAANTFTGGVTIRAGNVSLGASAAAGSSTIILGDSSGSADATLSFFNGAINVANAITVANGSTGNTLALQSGLTTGSTFSGAITMNHDLVLQNTSTGGSNITTGGITMNGNKLTVNNTSSGAWTISSVIAGNGAIEQNSSGSGAVNLQGANIGYTGAITVTQGTLNANGANTLGATTGVAAITNSGTINLTGAAGGVNYGGGQINLNNGSTLSYSQNTSSGSAITKKIAVAAAATTAINFTSGTTNRHIGFAQDGLEIGAGATLNHTITTTSQTGIMGSTEGVVTLLGNATVNVTAGFSLSTNQINYGKGVDDGVGTFSFTKGGTGNLLLGASVSTPAITGAVSTYGGTTTVDTGILRIGITDSLPDTALAVNLGATFDMSASGHNITNATFNQRVAGLNDGTGGGGTITGNRINTANSGSIGNRTLTLDGTSGTFAFSGVIENKPVANVTANNVLSLTKSGGSTQTLSGANTYTGLTDVQGGILSLNATGAPSIAGNLQVSGGTALFAQSNQIATTRSVIVSSGTLSLLGFSNTVAGVQLTGGAITGTGGILTSATAFDMQAGSASAILNGTTGLNKTTSGTTTLSGVNTYSGVTTVSGGVLRLENANALPGGVATAGGTSNLTFNGGVIGLGSGNSTFTRSLNTAATVTAATFTGAGGWAAYGANATVNLGGGGAITWATADTGFNSQTLILGASTADMTVDLQNNLDLGTAARTVQVDNGSAGIDAKLTGAITGGAGSELTKTGNGTLDLNGTPTYATLKTQAGVTNVNSSFTGGTATVNANATTNFTVSQTLDALNIGTVALAGPSFAGGSAVVPEPGTVALLLVGALGLGGRRRRGV